MKFVNAAEFQRELEIRVLAADSVFHYANAIDIPGKPASENPDEEFFLPIETTIAHHHRLILDAFDKVSKTNHGRLMVFLPPGSAKSTYGSVVFPSRYLGEKGGRKLILASYGDDLARKMGRRTRQICKQKRFKGIWGVELSKESSAADQFSLTNGSEYMACGLLSGITGNRANGIVIDDPVRGREQANSEAVSQKTWDAYQDDLLTRLIPGGWLAIIQTRWSEKDLAGRILPESWKGESGMIECRDGNKWMVLCIQARCTQENDLLGREIGEYLWPEWFDQKHWAQFESNPQTWASLFQQIPSPLEGGFFKPDMMPTIDIMPHDASTKLIRGWDFASTEGDGDFTAGVKIGKLKDGRFVIADVVRGQWGPDDRDRALKATASADGYQCKQGIPQDPGQAGKSQIQYLTKELQGFRVVSSPESGEKSTRAEPVASQVNVGNVVLLRGEWNQKFKDELRSFPNGMYDDQVDALSRGFNELIGKGGFKITNETLKRYGS